MFTNMSAPTYYRSFTDSYISECMLVTFTSGKFLDLGMMFKELILIVICCDRLTTASQSRLMILLKGLASPIPKTAYLP